MPRWEPNVKQRLEAAALDLFERHGYDAVTVTQVAEAAGVTSRTYFRQFPDKREVLFGGADGLRRQIAEGLQEAPADLAAFAAVVRAVASCDPLFVPDERGRLRRRDALVATTEELRERETMKLAVIADDLAAGLEARDLPVGVASLVADLGVVVLKEASRTWNQGADETFAELTTEAASRVSALANVAL